MISFIIPAHNEERLIGRTLTALHTTARALGEKYEIIVADDASTDRTSEIAREHNARVVANNCRQIAATRNAGARAATGDAFFFVDADTEATLPVLQAAMRALRRGAVGGGCTVRFDEGHLPFYATVVERVLPSIQRVVGMAAGCFLFCTRRAYLDAGGFNEAMDWGEEVAFGQRLKRQGRFVILREFVITSARKLRTHSALELLRVGARVGFGGAQARRKGLEYWYGKRLRV